eukprot:CAMPEP_0206138386 /NCGR_PEP_ID=MMETSP1473-20131121/3290_1 /ASSEMBLY_ACC=CAM_ASM_001109 /TAXON_ID=1461547 /ORGANISM="Stichococcus sp, Strain RCC1054" /LENGTH=63 /DNA_ID=CAMNT_0053531809 /DNA_START=112 /DNA_END=301 /DNA_ORIENTATION=+
MSDKMCNSSVPPAICPLRLQIVLERSLCQITRLKWHWDAAAVAERKVPADVADQVVARKPTGC